MDEKTSSPATASAEVPFRTSPSGIARYFFHDCERFFRYSASGAAQRKRDLVPEKKFDNSPVMKAILESGYTWEQTVLEQYLKDKVYCPSWNWTADLPI